MLGRARVGPTVSLVVVGADDGGLREDVLALRPHPEQERFAATAATTLPAADADPLRTPFAVLDHDRPVGFGVLDRGPHLGELVDDPSRAVLLRGFYVDAREQGRGLGSAAAAAVRELVATLHPDAELVVLTVNVANPAAVTAYRRGGFVDTGARYLEGDAGPQHVLVATPRRAGSPGEHRSGSP